MTTEREYLHLTAHLAEVIARAPADAPLIARAASRLGRSRHRLDGEAAPISHDLALLAQTTALLAQTTATLRATQERLARLEALVLGMVPWRRSRELVPLHNAVLAGRQETQLRMADEVLASERDVLRELEDRCAAHQGHAQAGADASGGEGCGEPGDGAGGAAGARGL